MRANLRLHGGKCSPLLHQLRLRQLHDRVFELIQHSVERMAQIRYLIGTFNMNSISKIPILRPLHMRSELGQPAGNRSGYQCDQGDRNNYAR
ncbi:hypothetical protein D3C85_1205630 [compost metagenome]